LTVTGQRYDVIINANQTVGNYWIRVATGGGGACDGPNANANNIRGIIRYSGAPVANPTSTGSVATGCSDETDIVPWVSSTVPSGSPTDLNVGFVPLAPNGSILIRWTINGSAIAVDWRDPTLEYVINGTAVFPTSENVYNPVPDNTVGSKYFIK
jgi:FtsP/CotA-like multicopper oxidase with cupredoxin domain